MNRQTLYLVILSVILLVGVATFSFAALIPKGKEYRSLRLQNKKETQKIELAQHRHDEVVEKLRELRVQNRHTIDAFGNRFDPERFSKVYRNEFEDLFVSEAIQDDSNGTFRTYEVNATSKITSPQSFYTFLEQVNKSEWVIAVNFPVHFERDGDRIRSSFTMRVYGRTDVKKESE